MCEAINISSMAFIKNAAMFLAASTSSRLCCASSLKCSGGGFESRVKAGRLAE